MQRCFQSAKLGNGFVEPNPMVGAVLVYQDRIIGEGYHQLFGEAHAEVNCINSVKNEDKHLISKSTLYVSLEPCSHYGKTPPCSDLIIENKIPKVVISIEDNFHLVNGKGIEKLRKNNIEVITGILENEGKELLKHFLYFQEHKKPFITLKYAQTNDGYIGIKDEEISISNPLAKKYVHRLRAEHQGILVGKNTVIADNPSLTLRHWNGKNPIRIIIGNENEFSKDMNIFSDEAETIFLSNNDNSKLNLDEILKKIASKNIISVLVEGGANILQQFIDANAWNETHIITSKNKMSEILKNNNSSTYIKAPVITGILQENITFNNNTVSILKISE